MENIKDIINHIVNEYVRFDNLFKDNNGYDLDDYDDHYRIWLDGMEKQVKERMQANGKENHID